jgi:2-polyprenyl-3-methyl-5-hydroxy-6-metoxy-1,4-benzoquinol methylase
MDNQDFEGYAEYKPFNTKIAQTWEAVANEALSSIVITPVSQLRLLDYGCGDGKYFPYFVTAGLLPENIYGLDVSQTRIGRCRDIGWTNAQLLVPNAPLPFADGQLDVINCMEVIEHIPAKEGERILAELRRVLRPSGCLLISTPNYPIKRFYDYFDAVVHGKHARFRDDPTHVTKFNHRRLEILLKTHFTRIESREFKAGFLYKRFRIPFFQHKLFFLCRA